jgi:hypothetical protein
MTDAADDIARYFDAFVKAFTSFDGKAVGALFVTPGVALTRDGALHGFSTQQDVEAYYQAALDHYRAQNCTSCRYADLHVQRLNDNSAIATASWDLLRGDGSNLNHWRQSYFLMRAGGAWRAYGSAFVSA